jgi:hypothetical protein
MNGGSTVRDTISLACFLLSVALFAVSCSGMRSTGTSAASEKNSSSGSIQPSGDPRDDVKKALTALQAAKSWRARLTTDGNVMEIEFVAPDRFHTKGQSEGRPFAGEMILIGNDAFVKAGSAGWRKMPPHMGFAETVNRFRHSNVVEEMMGYVEVKSLGTEVLDGAPMLVYQYKTKETEKAGVTIPAGVWKIWISARDGLPRRNESEPETDSKGSPAKTGINVVYYDYNSDFRIEPPSVMG